MDAGGFPGDDEKMRKNVSQIAKILFATHNPTMLHCLNVLNWSPNGRVVPRGSSRTERDRGRRFEPGSDSFLYFVGGRFRGRRSPGCVLRDGLADQGALV